MGAGPAGHTAGPTPTARGCFLWGWSEASIPCRAGQGWQLGVGSFFTVQKRRQKGAQIREVGGLWPETTARARCGLGLERDVAPPAGLHGAEGPCRESWWGRRALLLLVVGGGGWESDVGAGRRGVWALRVLYDPRPGVWSPWGEVWGRPCLQASVSQVTLGVEIGRAHV